MNRIHVNPGKSDRLLDKDQDSRGTPTGQQSAMALFRLGKSPKAAPRLANGRVTLRPPCLADFEAWSSLRRASHDFLTPWEPTWQADELTRSAFRKRIAFYDAERQKGRAFPLFIFTRLQQQDAAAQERLVGGLTLGHVRRGAIQSCTLGYWMGAPFAGRGLMTEAVMAIIPHAFDDLRLHRIEAACIPENTSSRRLLEKTGFQREGLARRYLKINGLWRDHLLYALLADDTRPQISQMEER